MGGHGGLNILPQKRWNVYNRENRFKVAQDEAKAKEAEDAEEERHQQAEREYRHQTLLQRARIKEGQGGAPATNLLVAQEQQHQQLLQEPAKGSVAPLEHINFWKDEEICNLKAQHPEVEAAKLEEARKRGKANFYTTDPKFDERFQLGYQMAGDKPWYAKKPAPLPPDTIEANPLIQGNKGLAKQRDRIAAPDASSKAEIGLLQTSGTSDLLGQTCSQQQHQQRLLLSRKGGHELQQELLQLLGRESSQPQVLQSFLQGEGGLTLDALLTVAPRASSNSDSSSSSESSSSNGSSSNSESEGSGHGRHKRRRSCSKGSSKKTSRKLGRKSSSSSKRSKYKSKEKEVSKHSSSKRRRRGKADGKGEGAGKPISIEQLRAERVAREAVERDKARLTLMGALDAGDAEPLKQGYNSGYGYATQLKKPKLLARAR